MSKQCKECDAKCCRYFCFEIDEPDTYEEFEDIRWFLCHEGISVHIDEGDWYIHIDNKCKMLTPSGRCRIYDDRPLICRSYSTGNCDQAAGDYNYDELFETPEQIEAYAHKTLGEKAFERARKRERMKLEKKAKKKS